MPAPPLPEFLTPSDVQSAASLDPVIRFKHYATRPPAATIFRPVAARPRSVCCCAVATPCHAVAPSGAALLSPSAPPWCRVCCALPAPVAALVPLSAAPVAVMVLLRCRSDAALRRSAAHLGSSLANHPRRHQPHATLPPPPRAPTPPQESPARGAFGTAFGRPRQASSPAPATPPHLTTPRRAPSTTTSAWTATAITIQPATRIRSQINAFVQIIRARARAAPRQRTTSAWLQHDAMDSSLPRHLSTLHSMSEGAEKQRRQRLHSARQRFDQPASSQRRQIADRLLHSQPAQTRSHGTSGRGGAHSEARDSQRVSANARSAWSRRTSSAQQLGRQRIGSARSSAAQQASGSASRSGHAARRTHQQRKGLAQHGHGHGSRAARSSWAGTVSAARWLLGVVRQRTGSGRWRPTALVNTPVHQYARKLRI
ncbi:hypothetical protein M2351_005392 [Azospirillum canadense]|nr:hypothetical protein [Azospirillum canadense]